MESWGFKKRMTGLKHPWQRRYFRIDTNSTELSYLKTPSDTKSRGTIDVLTLLRLAPTDEGLKNSRDPAVKTFGSFALDLHTSEPRVYHIIFESQKILEGWVLALWKVCDQSVCKLHPTFSAIKGIRAATVQPSKQPQQQRTLEGGSSSTGASSAFDPTPMPLPPALAARVAAAAASRGGEGSIGGGGSGGSGGNGNGNGGGGGGNSSSTAGPGTSFSPLPSTSSSSSSSFFSSSRNIASSPANPFKLVDLDRDDPEADRMLMGGGGAVEMQSLRQQESSSGSSSSSNSSSRGLPPSRGGASFRGRGRGGGRGRGRGGGAMSRPTFGAASKSELAKRLLDDEEDEDEDEEEEDDSDSDSDDSDDDEDEEDEEGGKKGGCCTIS